MSQRLLSSAGHRTARGETLADHGGDDGGQKTSRYDMVNDCSNATGRHLRTSRNSSSSIGNRNEPLQSSIGGRTKQQRNEDARNQNKSTFNVSNSNGSPSFCKDRGNVRQKKRNRSRSLSSDRAYDEGVDGDNYSDEHVINSVTNSAPSRRNQNAGELSSHTNTTSPHHRGHVGTNIKKCNRSGQGREQETHNSVEEQERTLVRKSKRKKRRKRRRKVKNSPLNDTQLIENEVSTYSVRGVVSIDEEGPGQKQQHIVQPKEPSNKKTGTRSASVHDDTVGHFQGEPGSTIARYYQVVQQIGIGTFGRVLECLDTRLSTSAGVAARNPRYHSLRQHHHARCAATEPRNDRVAIKVVRNIKRYHDSALIEAGIISDINRRGGRGLTHCVVMHDAFDFGGHYCMVFECLGPSLYDFLKSHHYRPFPMVCVRSFTVQLLETLEFLHSFRLIHTDLKIENIVLTNNRVATFDKQKVPESTRIKVIDFGGACYDDDKKSSVINTRQYRAPEVMLGTGWSMPSDMWSLGCILAELYRGELLFATHDNIEHLALIENMIGPFPRGMIKKARSTNQELVGQAFNRNGRHRMEAVLASENAAFVRKSRPIKNIVRLRSETWFSELLYRILVIDPVERWTAHECLQFLSRI